MEALSSWRADSGFYGDPLFEQLERSGVTYPCGVPLVAMRCGII
jgi:hypothetical protein